MSSLVTGAPRVVKRRVPIGAEVAPDGVHFRVWAESRKRVEVALEGGSGPIPLEPEGNGYFSGFAPGLKAGALYRYRLDGGDAFPDPASRYQPQGAHGPSEVVDPATFSWTDAKWPGVTLCGQVVYEMHIGTFTPEGTWRSAAEALPRLADVGITLLEVMPVCEFPGRFGWGYDGVNLFAPVQLYGRPDDFRFFVDRAHSLGIAVVLDVVYNHFGPDGNYLAQFSKHYFTSKHKTDWGEAINYDSDDCQPVREFFLANARYWIEEFHLDGLRLDATQDIYDDSEPHIIADIARVTREAAGKKGVVLIGENEPQKVQLIRPPEKGGYGLDALWNDDFHHSAMARLTGRNGAYYTDYLGTPQEFVSAAKYGYLYQGQLYKWQRQRRGTSSRGTKPESFVTFIGNHDQIANSARGLRPNELSAPGVYKAMTALMLLGPGTPMLFQGQEYCAPQPFLYFADHKPEIARLVAAGRRKFLAQWRDLRMDIMTPCFADPADLSTFERCKLDPKDIEPRQQWLDLHKDLLRLRREDPVFSRQGEDGLDGAVLSADAFLLRFFAPDGNDRLLLVNFGLDLTLYPAPEPLLAPPDAKQWGVMWSSEDPCYNGCAQPPLETAKGWMIPGHAAVALKPEPRQKELDPAPMHPDEEEETKKKK